MIKKQLEIIPTVWIQKEEFFHNLVKIYYMNGIRKLRINCTRRSPKKYIDEINYLNSICEEEVGSCMEIMIDIPYPRKKIRIDKYKGEKNINKGKTLYLTSDFKVYARENNIIYTKTDMKEYLDIGVNVVVGDSEPEFVVTQMKEKEHVYCLHCLKSGKIKYKKSITTDKLKFISNTDTKEIRQFKKMVLSINPSIIALSCVESAEEVLKAKKDLGVKDSVQIMAKIENEAGSRNITEIGKVADSVMIARGDLLINCGERGFVDAMERSISQCEKEEISYYMATGILDGIVDNQLTRSELRELFYLQNSKCKGVIMEYDKCNTAEVFRRMIKYFRKTSC